MDLTKSISYNLSKTGDLLQQLSAHRMRKLGIDLTPEESIFLHQLWDRDCQSQAELNPWSIKGASTVTRQIDKLVRKGYVERQSGVKDRRTVVISLTNKGKALEQEFRKTGIAKLDDDFLSVSKSEGEFLLALLTEVRAKIMKEIGR